MGGLKNVLILLVLGIIIISGCSLFVAQPPQDDNKVCVSKTKLDAVLTQLNITVSDLDDSGNNQMVATDSGSESLSDSDGMAGSEDMSSVDGKGDADESSASTNTTSSSSNTGTTTTDSTNAQIEQPSTTDGMTTKYYNEGELVKLSPKATDADGDQITFTYSSPLNDKGEWQTEIGDAGEYIVTVTATDGKSTVTKKIKIVITTPNSAPVISEVSDVTVNEGEAIIFSPVVNDEDSDDITVTYSGWMTSSTYITKNGDAGVYDVTISASDGTTVTEKKVKVTVVKNNKAPTISNIDYESVKEGETVTLSVTTSDPDGDDVSLSYSSPLDSNGEWETVKGDAGTYLITVTASDGSLEEKKTVTIEILSDNSAPTISIEDKTVVIQSGETGVVTLNPMVSDPEGDQTTTTFSGWMTSSQKTVTESDVGDHSVTITATDGELETSVTITVTIEINQPPEFDFS